MIQEIHKAIASDEALELIKLSTGGTPCSGGCLIVAKAIQLAVRGHIAYLESDVDGGQVEHFGVELPTGEFIDGEVSFESEELWRQYYEVQYEYDLRVFWGVPDEHEITDDASASKELAQIIFRYL